MNFNHFHEFRRFQQQQQDNESGRKDAVVGLTCLGLCGLYAILTYMGVI